jgi:hypothetical protein
VELVVFAEEFGGVLLTETEFYMDHAAEHQASLWKQLSGGAWQSAGWQLVTVYYWAYFLAVSLTRLLGRSVWYIDDTVASHLTTLAATGGRVGAGTFAVTCGSSISLTDREVLLKKGSGRVHDHLWRVVFAAIESFVKLSPPTVGSLEERLYTAVLQSSRFLGSDWPSAVRNLVNYRPGVGYGAVRRLVGIPAIKRHEQPVKFENLLERFENDVAALDASRALEAQIAAASKSLVTLTFMLNALVREIYKDTLSRSGLDRRWDRSRDRFLTSHGVISESGCWPA